MNQSNWNLEHSYATLPASFYTLWKPAPAANPQIILLNAPLAEELGLSEAELRSADGAAMLAGNQLPPNAKPLAQAYAGHQYGHFTMLGDGRALLLGEQITPSNQRYDIQLKGSGQTPYSRRGDGKAALGPMLREYIISEAMAALGIPTTRSLAVVSTSEQLMRETAVPAAILTRIASSHIRVGTFEYAARLCSLEDLQALADYTLNRHFPDHQHASNRYLYLLEQVIARQASLLAKWQLAGFVHGVMNTDNMSICGETIDYGPCAFLDQYDPDAAFSSIDTYGRYAYNQQPHIALWNLTRFAETLIPLLTDEKKQAIQLAEQALRNFQPQYHNHWLKGMGGKLGIMAPTAADEPLMQQLLALMAANQADYANTFRALTLGEDTLLSPNSEYKAWEHSWKQRVRNQSLAQEEIQTLMRSSNPSVIPRNHRVEEAIAAAYRQDYKPLNALLDILQHPYDYTDCQIPYVIGPDPSFYPYRTYCGT